MNIMWSFHWKHGKSAKNDNYDCQPDCLLRLPANHSTNNLCLSVGLPTVMFFCLSLCVSPLTYCFWSLFNPQCSLHNERLSPMSSFIRAQDPTTQTRETSNEYLINLFSSLWLVYFSSRLLGCFVLQRDEHRLGRFIGNIWAVCELRKIRQPTQGWVRLNTINVWWGRVTCVTKVNFSRE